MSFYMYYLRITRYWYKYIVCKQKFADTIIHALSSQMVQDVITVWYTPSIAITGVFG